MKRKSSIAGIYFCLLVTTATAVDTNSLSLIPWPQKVTIHAGAFKLTPDTRIYVDSCSRETGKVLTERLRKCTGYPLGICTRAFPSTAIKGGILLTTKDANTNLGAEGYELTVAPDSIVIRAPNQAGLFYGVQTLFHLLPPEAFSSNCVTSVDWQVPCVQIKDWPRFKWRGLMLDVARHFYSKHEVERLLDTMALQKLNVFHWHLTDDQGWRIEIRKYPKLTQIGAWRADVGFGLVPASATAYGPDGRYGGFYTPADIREVVAYAAARHITIVPEIEMPGHSTAALSAYPQFSCTGGPFIIPLNGGVFHGIYNPANEETFKFLDNVLIEVFQLFPGKYVHLGGDEVPTDTWKNSPECQALMKQEGLKNEEELQSWFLRRIETFVSSHGHTMIGWSEILRGGLASNAVVMDWIGGATEASSFGHDVVMTPTGYCYLDLYQSEDHSTEPRAIGGFISLGKIYSFEPTPENLPMQFEAHILGAQANLWTECIPNLNYAEYMIFPRLTALAEVDWSPRSARNFDDFSRRLQFEFQRFDQIGVNYRRITTNAPAANPAK